MGSDHNPILAATASDAGHGLMGSEKRARVVAAAGGQEDTRAQQGMSEQDGKEEDQDWLRLRRVCSWCALPPPRFNLDVWCLLRLRLWPCHASCVSIILSPMNFPTSRGEELAVYEPEITRLPTMGYRKTGFYNKHADNRPVSL